MRLLYFLSKANFYEFTDCLRLTYHDFSMELLKCLEIELKETEMATSLTNTKKMSRLIRTLGGFPMEIKPEIRYLIICCYLNFTL